MRPKFAPIIIAALLVLAGTLRATDGGFTATLSQPQQVATGAGNLSAEEAAALNALVAGEVALARQGAVSGFAGTFSSRRSPEERDAAGIDRMTAAEVAEIDRLVAALIAAGPPTRDIPVRLKKDDVSSPRDRFETHGEISFTYGRGSGGRSFQGGSLSTTVFDRETGNSLSFTYGQYEGDLFPYYGDRHFYGPTSTLFGGGIHMPRANFCRPR